MPARDLRSTAALLGWTFVANRPGSSGPPAPIALLDTHSYSGPRRSVRATTSGTIRSFVSINSLISAPNEGQASETRRPLPTATSHQSYSGSSFVPSAAANADGTPASLDKASASAQSMSEGSPGIGGESETNGLEDDADDSRLTAAGEKSAGPKKPKKRKERDREPLRSSIACQRCRASKIKCNNNGDLSSPCPACLKSGRECIFPEANPPAKRGHDPGSKSDLVTAERKRFKPAERGSARLDDPDSIRAYADEILAAQYLNESIWGQIFDIYKLHYAAELPFLHLASLKSMIRKGKGERPHEVNLVLLGVLALCTRFHPSLAFYVAGPKAEPGDKRLRAAPTSEDATSASLFFVDALTKGLGDLRESMTQASVERVQAYLMLGLYEWTQPDPRDGGLSAWMFVGNAIRMAQALGLGFGDRPWRPWPDQPSSTEQEDATLLKEIKRRTMYSCFITDRLLGCGDDRFSVIRSEDLQIQLPCTDVMFDLRGEGYTGFLRPRSDDPPVQKTDISVQACFLRLLDIWGEISRWSLAGGRLTEAYEPWSPESTFYRLRVKLDEFNQSLPAIFKWSTTNYDSHANHGAATPFVAIHVLGSLCRMILHRESLPFVPLRCSKPSGPLDQSAFMTSKEPFRFWDDNAAEVFHAASVIASIVDTCRDKLPVSSLVLFATWTAAFMASYAAHFGHMDPNGYLSSRYNENSDRRAADSEVGRTEYTIVLLDALSRMAAHMRMAGRYMDLIKDLDSYYVALKQDYDGLARSLTHHPKKSVDGGGQGDTAKDSPKAAANGSARPELADALMLAARSALEQTMSENGQHDGERPNSAAGPLPASAPGRDTSPQRANFANIQEYLDKHQSRTFSRGPWSVNGLSNPGQYYDEDGLGAFVDMN
ncbi:hypothetical protein GQ53DRAFT_770638 [Thozetella sp. PMI_491]|nr:hypothetical protein GQ53DRAFT_770638 [Thozetella sp. PMI_491]